LLENAVQKYPTRVRTHLDLAGGTGLVSEFFRKQGWFSIVIDASLPMLQLARRRTPNAAAGDYRSLPLRGTFSRITCLYDSLNHLTRRDELEAAFRQIRSVMDDDSLFFFDINHPDVYPDVWGMADPFVAHGPDFHLEIHTSFRQTDSLGQALVRGWARLENGERVNIREQHRQRAYSEKEIVDALTKAGLAVVEATDFDPYNDGVENVKLFFVCRSVNRRAPTS
jgi:SAM-dependent methyltransferase